MTESFLDKSDAWWQTRAAMRAEHQQLMKARSAVFHAKEQFPTTAPYLTMREQLSDVYRQCSVRLEMLREEFQRHETEGQ